MKNNKKGFTLSEVLICITIVGVIMALSVNTLKVVKASYSSLAYFEYNNIKEMVTALMSGISSIQENDNLPITTVNCRLKNGRIVTILKPDGSEKSVSGEINDCSAASSSNAESSFCKTIVEISGTSGKTYCDKLYSAGYDSEPYIKDLSIDNPTFVTTNGRRYYITKHEFDNNVSDEYGFRLIAVDLNGESGPNVYSHDNKSNKQPPDIITFLVTDNGEVYPLDVAADNIFYGEEGVIQYINSRVKGYYFSDIEREGTVPAECTRKIKGKSEQICNYAVINIPNPVTTGKRKTLYSFREAYCTANENSTYKQYCRTIAKYDKCPPSNKSGSEDDQSFDLCIIENIKPSFRYNL